MDADAGTLLRYRKNIGADAIAIFTDIKKKHSSHALSADVSLAQTAEAAAFFRSDGLIITGTATGAAAQLDDFHQVRQKVQLPLLVGSGLTIDNITNYLPLADALIVGSWFKQEGHWANALDYDRVATFMEKVNTWRANTN